MIAYLTAAVQTGTNNFNTDRHTTNEGTKARKRRNEGTKGTNKGTNKGTKERTNIEKFDGDEATTLTVSDSE